MDFKNTKPTAADFFRKYSDLVTEAEKEDVADAKTESKTCKTCKKEPCACETKKTKKPLKESINPDNHAAVAAGKKAAKDGKSKSDNPYTDSMAKKLWDKHFDQASDKKETVKESTGLYQKMMGESWESRAEDEDSDEFLAGRFGKLDKKGNAKVPPEADSKKKKQKTVGKVKESAESEEPGKPARNPGKGGVDSKLPGGKGWPDSQDANVKSNQEKLKQKYSPKNPVDEAKTVFDPITKKKVPVKPIKQQAGGSATKNGVPFEPGSSKKWAKKEVKEGETSSNLGISQGGRYGDSSDFESDVSDIEQSLKRVMMILGSPEWNEWMRETDFNYGGSSSKYNQKFTTTVQQAQVIFDKLYSHMVDLGEK